MIRLLLNISSICCINGQLCVFLYLLLFQFDVMVYNPLSHHGDHIVVRLPVSRKDLVVMDTGSNDVMCQVSMLHYVNYNRLIRINR